MVSPRSVRRSPEAVAARLRRGIARLDTLVKGRSCWPDADAVVPRAILAEYHRIALAAEQWALEEPCSAASVAIVLRQLREVLAGHRRAVPVPSSLQRYRA